MDEARRLHPSVQRILDRTGLPGLVDVLGRQLSGPDLTSLLMAAMAARAESLEAPGVLRRYRADRFSSPGSVGYHDMRLVEDAMIEATPADWAWLTLSPVAPLGTHSAVAGVSQNRVVTTTRSSDVAADPTNALALEAAVRRSSGEANVRLASIQRVIRAQRFQAEAAFSHFTIFALVSAGRSLEGHRFERDALIEHLEIHAAGLHRVGADRVEVFITDLTGTDIGGALEAITHRFAGAEGVDVLEDPDREEGRDYYRDVCFKVRATFGPRSFEVADGGLTDWARRMLSDRYEQLCISGAGLDRVALMAAGGA